MDAQQARRVLDRLVGYAVSPILWDKVRRGSERGPRPVRGPEAHLRPRARDPRVQVRGVLDGRGPPRGRAAARLPREPPQEGRQGHRDRQRRRGGGGARPTSSPPPFKVEKVQARERRRNPVPPFITSKLQQEGFRKLGFPVRKTMQVAQRLYEGVELGEEGAVGLITYMRTDSVRVSADALTAVREHVGADATARTTSPRSRTSTRARRTPRTRTRRSGPTYLDHDPEKIKRYLSKDELKVYTPHLEPLRGLADAAGGLRRDGGGHLRHARRGTARVPAAREGLDPQVQGLPRRLRRGARREGRAEAEGGGGAAPGSGGPGGATTRRPSSPLSPRARRSPSRSSTRTSTSRSPRPATARRAS